MTLSPGTRLGPYEVLGPIGAGGMGQVFRARDARLGRDVAVKVLPPELAGDPERLARFEREARVLAALNHPNVAAIYGLEDAFGSPALVLELVDGETLADRIARGRLAVRDALAVARQVAEGLDAAHEAGIVHRDLKPGNVALTRSGTAKVLDFGLAKPSASAPVHESDVRTLTAATREGVVLGTAAYMSPEQARGRAVDKRTDVWAFGCVLFEMLTGRLAFGGDTLPDMLAAVLEREPDLAALPAATPGAVRRLLRRCLDKDPRRRLRDIGDARLELDEALDEIGAGERAAGAAPAARGSRGATWAALIALPIAGAALAWLVLGQSRARVGFDVEASTIVPASERPITSAIAPDGAWVAYIGLAGGRPDLYVRFLNGSAPANLTAEMNMPVQNRTIVGGLDVMDAGRGIALAGRPVREGLFRVPGIWVVPAPAGGPAERVTDRYAAARWSPDGRRIAGVIADPLAGDAVATANRDGRSERVLVAASGGIHLHQLAWGHDGRHIYYQRSLDPRGWAADIYRVPVDGGTPEPVVVGEGTAAFPAPTPDGRALVYAADRTGEGSNIWYRPFDGSPPRRLTAGAGEYAEPFLSGDGTELVCLARRRKGELIRIPVDGLDRSAATIGEAGSGDSDPSMVASRPRIVISSRRTGRRKIWSVDETGRLPQPLTTGDGTDYRPVASPDGRSVAFLSNRDGRRGLWVAPADGGPARLIVHAEVVDYVSWAPDSRRLVYAAAADVGTQLWTAGQDGTPPARVPQGVGRTPAWSPAGDVIAVVQADGDRPVVRFVSSSGNEVRAALRLDGVGVPTAVAWSPDGARLAFVNLPGRGAAEVWVGRPSDGDLRRVAEEPAPGEFEGVTWTPDGRSLVVGRIEYENEVVLIRGLPARR